MTQTLLEHESIEVPIFFGTQTGTAREVACELARDARRRYFKASVLSLDDFDVTQLPNIPLAVFVCATSGQGEVPDNMREFWKFILRKSLPQGSLSGLTFAVFGLGDSSYIKFNFVSKMLYNRLAQLGATPLLRRGDGNDQHPFGLYGDLYTWQEELWRKLLTLHPLPPGVSVRSNAERPASTFIIETAFAPSGAPLPSEHEASQVPLLLAEGQFEAALLGNERLTAAESDWDVRHVRLGFDGQQHTYSPGDVVSIQPENPAKGVLKFLEVLKHDSSTIITAIRPRDPEAPPFAAPLPLRLSELVARHVDFLGTPRRYFFELLAHFASSPVEADKLRELASQKGYEELYEYAIRAKRSYLDVLVDFSSAAVPLEYLLDLFPPIQARLFSISSAQVAAPNELQVSMVVVHYDTALGRPKRGLCSTWLSKLDAATRPRLAVSLRPGTMRLPEPAVPLILVGPGTGCAIFRAFLHHREWQRQQGARLAPAVFFFGCRHEQQDFLYVAEWAALQASGTLTRLFVAFSRDQQRKRYVQHLIAEQQTLVWELLSQGAVVAVSGRRDKMPREVRQAIVAAVRAGQGSNEGDSEKYVAALERSGRYLTETWS